MQKAKKIVEVPGFEPGAFRMQSERDTTTPHPQECLSIHSSDTSIRQDKDLQTVNTMAKVCGK